MGKSTFPILSTFLFAAIAVSANASTDTVLAIVQGSKQGQFKGEAKGNTIRILSAESLITSPRDAATGLPTGKRVHNPFIIDVALDPTAPMFFNALTNNEALEVTLDHYARAGNGDAKTYEVKLTNAQIASISYKCPTDVAAPAYLEISLVYQKITWTWTQGGITAADNWNVRA